MSDVFCKVSGVCGIAPAGTGAQQFLRTHSELLVAHAVNYDIPAAVCGQYPEGEEREVAPLIPKDVPHHKNSDRSEGGGEDERQRPDDLGSLDVREGGFGCALALALSQVFPALGVLSDG